MSLPASIFEDPLVVGVNACRCKECGRDWVAVIEPEDIEDGCTRTSMFCPRCLERRFAGMTREHVEAAAQRLREQGEGHVPRKQVPLKCVVCGAEDDVKVKTFGVLYYMFEHEPICRRCWDLPTDEWKDGEW